MRFLLILLAFATVMATATYAEARPSNGGEARLNINDNGQQVFHQTYTGGTAYIYVSGNIEIQQYGNGARIKVNFRDCCQLSRITVDTWTAREATRAGH
jgi:hypothetical protein